ncbi:MAG: DUF2691 family protein [Oscillospiraceae bacterium]|jgi:hypothetical protein|nr:DUF2691 family protein [Oscillospiraceae bacterium]
MMGIRFEVENEYGNFLKQIFSSVDVINYEWQIVTNDSIKSMIKIGDRFFSENLFGDGDTVIDGKTFLKNINLKSYYMIFIDLKAFLIGSTHKEIQSYEDYLNSDCQIVFMCVDSSYIEVFCKDKSILEIIHKNCINYNFMNIELISHEECLGRSMLAF